MQSLQRAKEVVEIFCEHDLMGKYEIAGTYLAEHPNKSEAAQEEYCWASHDSTATPRWNSDR